jgi:high affinity sulfate transporter 1
VARGGSVALRRIMPGLAALRSYDRAWLPYDLVAGLSVAAVAVPVAIAYSQLAGLPPVYGLYASILPLLAYALFGTSRQLIMAPDAATCAIVAAVVIPLAGEDLSRQVSLSMTLAVITGIFCIFAGLARLGFLTNFLSRPILAGYLNGIALAIIASQLGKLLGFSVKPARFFHMIAEFGAGLEQTHGLTLIVGATTFVLLRLLRRLGPKVPGPLVVVALGIVASLSFHLGERGVALVGSIPAGFPRLMVPNVGLDDLEPLAFGAVGLALISFNSAMVTARGFATRNRYELDANQEFIALGVADIGAGLLQGFAVSGADSRTAVNDSVGGKSQVTGLVAAGLFVVTLLFLTVPLAHLPVAVLSAVLVNSAIGLFDLPSLGRLWRISHQEFAISIITLLGVITVGVLKGVIVAVGVAIVQLLAKGSHPHDAVVGRLPGTGGYHDLKIHPEARTTPGILLFRFDGPLIFFNADRFRSRVRTVIGEAASEVRFFVLDAEVVSGVDSTGALALGELREELAGKGIGFAIAEAKTAVRSVIERAGLQAEPGAELYFTTLDAAVAQLKPRCK